MGDGDTLATTTSLCPTCLEQVPGRYEERDDGVHLARDCPDHGTATRQVWGSLDHWEWAADFGPSPEYDGGDLTVDDDHACLAVVEVTEDCNLSCSYCFASSGPGGNHRSTGRIEAMLDTVAEKGGRPVQFSGGEPTVRDDLPELVAMARERGIDHVEVNTNGIRLANEDGYARELADAGATAVYLQFDGLRAETYEQIREVDLTDEKAGAIEACRDADLPVVLVPTVVPGVNDGEMGDIVRFAVEHRDVVRSVNFQPVAHFGRYAKNEGRFAIDDAARMLAEQLDPVEPRDLLPAPCCSSYCQIGTALVSEGAQASVAEVNGVAGAVVGASGVGTNDGDGAVGDTDGPAATADDRDCADGECASTDGVADSDDGVIESPKGFVGRPIEEAADEFVPLTKFVDDRLWDTLTGLVDERDYMELLAGTAAGEEWACKTAGCCGLDVPSEMEGLFDDVVPVTLTGFMDADGADVNRLDNCCISVPTPDGELVPFCGYNMTTEDGEYALRNRNDWGGRPSVAEPAAGGYDGGGPDDSTTADAGDDVAVSEGDVPAPDGGRSAGSTVADGDTGDDACGCGPGGCDPDDGA
jgi:uncharacterized radical SAM superfamily Fe-S cluster-containing enzyme